MCVFAAPLSKKTPVFPPLLFSAVPFIWGRRDVMFCCFCKRGASEESLLCAGLYCQRCQKGEGHFFIWHLFPTCSIGWEMHSKNKRQLRTPLPPLPLLFSLFFQKAVSIWELYFWGLLTCRCVQGQYLSTAIMQLVICHKTGPTYLWRTHRLHDKSPPPRMSFSDSLCSILSGCGSRW